MEFNRNGSADLGPTQVNITRDRPLARYARMPRRVVATRLINDLCLNIEAAVAIMRV